MLAIANLCKMRKYSNWNSTMF